MILFHLFIELIAQAFILSSGGAQAGRCLGDLGLSGLKVSSRKAKKVTQQNCHKNKSKTTQKDSFSSPKGEIRGRDEPSSHEKLLKWTSVRLRPMLKCS